MVKLEKMSKESLKLCHEEYKLFLQIIWSGLLTLTISLFIGSFTQKIDIEPLTAVLIGVIAIFGGIILTLIVFANKFNEIREQIDKEDKK